VGKVRIIRSLVLDASALTEAAREASQLRIQVRRIAARGASLYTTAATLTEVLRGGSADVPIHRLLDSLNVQVVDHRLGRAAGERIGRTRTRGNVTLDAIVAEVASTLPRPVAVLTADTQDITALVDPDVMVLDIAA